MDGGFQVGSPSCIAKRDISNPAIFASPETGD